MAVLRYASRAERDLAEIASYSFATWGSKRADRYLADLRQCCENLVHSPLLGRACDDICPGLRRMEHARHVIFYRHKKYGVRVTRILHQRMLPQVASLTQ